MGRSAVRTGMDAHRHARIKQVFFAVQALPQAQWDAALERECGNDGDLRKEVQSLLAHHRSQSLIVDPTTSSSTALRRVAPIAVGDSIGRKREDDQRQLLHKRLRHWILILYLVAGFAVMRAYALPGRTEGLVDRWPYAALLGSSLGLLGLSACFFALRSPSYTHLRRLEVALSLAGATLLMAWSQIRLRGGIELDKQSEALFAATLSRAYWFVTSTGITYVQMPRAMVVAHTVTFWCAFGIFYTFIIPNSRQRSVTMIAANIVFAEASLVIAACMNPAFRPYLLANVIFSTLTTSAFSFAAVYISQQVTTLRQAILEARKVGQYQLLRPLGAGAMGNVYLAQHHLLRRPCAVKLVRPELAGRHAWLRRFEREVQAMAQLTHPNAVEIYDFGHTEDDSFFYAMEYLPGMTLEAMMRAYGPMAPGRVIYLLLQICGALGEAHGKGMVHRDVKPGNIIVAERGGMYDFIKLLDFGLVHAIGDDAEGEQTKDRNGIPAQLTQIGQVLGTPAYMSPEQIRREALDARSDIYSLGCLAYFLLAGHPPFQSESLEALLDAHLYRPVDESFGGRAEIPNDLKAIVVNCLSKDREARFQNVFEVEEALRKSTSASSWDNTHAARWWRHHPLIEADAAPAANQGKSIRR